MKSFGFCGVRVDVPDVPEKVSAAEATRRIYREALQPEQTCTGCGKKTRQECGLVECANRKPITADLDPRAFESEGFGCYKRKKGDA